MGFAGFAVVCACRGFNSEKGFFFPSCEQNRVALARQTFFVSLSLIIAESPALLSSSFFFLVFLSDLLFFPSSFQSARTQWVVCSPPPSTMKQRLVRTSLFQPVPLPAHFTQATTRSKTNSRGIECWPRTKSRCCSWERESLERSVLAHVSHHSLCSLACPSQRCSSR